MVTIILHRISPEELISGLKYRRSDTIVERGCIIGSTTEGRVSGEKIENSHIGVFARISGGTPYMGLIAITINSCL